MRPFPKQLLRHYLDLEQVILSPLKIDNSIAISEFEFPTGVFHLQNRSPRDGLEIYHKQYWFRLIQCLQDLCPRTLFRLGYTEFNTHARNYIQTHRDQCSDLNQYGSRFFAELKNLLKGDEQAQSCIQYDEIIHCLHRSAKRQTWNSVPDLEFLFSQVWTVQNGFLYTQNHHIAFSHNHVPTQNSSEYPMIHEENILIFSTSTGIAHSSIHPQIAKLWDLMQQIPLEQALENLDAPEIGPFVEEFLKQGIQNAWWKPWS